MKDFKLLQKLFFFMALGLFLCTLQACSEEDDDESIVDVSNDYGNITKNSLVATGGYRDVKPLRATILSSINTTYQGSYSCLGVEFTPHQANFNSSETRCVDSRSGITDGHFETDLSSNGEGLLEPGTTYYYRSYAWLGGSRYNGETRSFVTPDLQLSEGDFVDLGLSVKWASCNMGAKTPEVAGTLLQQCYAFDNFNNDSPNKFDIFHEDYDEGDVRDFPESVKDGNWLGTPDYDVATRTLGSRYRIPTEEEWKELEEKCSWKSGVCNGIKGFYINDRVDGSAMIFLPYVKKSSKYDITVYLSAPDDMIKNLERSMELEAEYHWFLENATGREVREQGPEIFREFINNKLDLEEELGVGEVLTEDTHIYCDYGLILRAFDPGEVWMLEDFVDWFVWTHPETSKEYNFYEVNGVNGSGVLYVRPVSNN